MLERTNAVTNEVLEPITFVLAYPTVFVSVYISQFSSHDVSVRNNERLLLSVLLLEIIIFTLCICEH